MDRVLFIIPAYNEAKNIGQVLDDIAANFGDADVLVVDDHSRDDTAEIARSHGADCVSHPFNMGYACALQTGFKVAVAAGYDRVVQFDGDGQHVASEVRRLYDHSVANDCDIVIGSRFLEDTGYSSPFFRRLGTRIFSSLIRLICKRLVTDPTSGLQVLSRRCFKAYSEFGGYPDYPDANLLISAIRSGYLVDELPVAMKQRTSGESMHGGVFKPIRYMAVMFYSILIIVLRRGRNVERE